MPGVTAVPRAKDAAHRADRIPQADSLPAQEFVHDLQQPLAGIIALTDPGAGERPGAKNVLVLDQVRSLAVWMQELLLSWDQYRASAVDADAVRSDPDEVCRSVVASAVGAGAVLTLVGSSRPELVGLDQVDLRRLVANVVDNAVRAAGPSGHVEMTLSVAQDRVVIDVTDDGPGFGTMEAHSGRGLTIVRRLVERCQGTLKIADTPQGGVHVRILLPTVSASLPSRAS